MKKAHLLAAVAAIGLATGAHAVTISYNPIAPADDGQFNGYVSNCFNCDIAPISSYGVWSPVQAGIFNNTSIYSDRPSNAGSYYSVYNGLTLTLTTSAAKNDDGISFVWGSPSYDNVLSVGNLVLKGDSVASAFPGVNGVLVTITGLANFSSVDFNELYIDPVTHQPGPQFAFEFDNVNILHSDGPPPCVTGAPEPSTWAMMAIGFAGLGFAAKRRANTARLASI